MSDKLSDKGGGDQAEVTEAPVDPFADEEPAVADLLVAAEHADDPDDFRAANEALFADLAAVARARGRTPVPKPRAKTHGPPPQDEAGDDAWTWS